MSRKRKARKSAGPRIKVWLEINGDYVFGRGICDILQAVDDAGSIKEAANRVQKSYRHVWARIKDAENAIGEALVVSKVGGTTERRSELTPLARELVSDFVILRQTMIDRANAEFAKRFSTLQ